MHARPATDADIGAIADLAARTFALACPPGTPQADIDRHIATQLNAERFGDLMGTASFFVVDSPDGGVCGYAMLADEPPPVPGPWRNPAELRRIYVDGDLHGRGVAAMLMRACLDEAGAQGRDWIWLGTNVNNERALRFYEKAGFAVVGERDFTVGTTVEHDYVLARELPGHTVGE